MNWYYTLAGQTYGPLTEAELDALVQAGTLPPTTLVWQTGMAGWIPYSEARPAAPAPADLTPAPAPAPTPAPAPATSTGLRVAGSPLRVQSAAQTAPQTNEPPMMDVAGCSQCGGVFPKDQVGEFGGLSVCARCRPALMQRVRSGAGAAAAHGSMQFAGFWIRFAAMLIDGVIYNILAYGLSYIMGLALGLKGQIAAACIAFALFMLYDVACTVQMGGTLGKRACRLRVVTADGLAVSYPLALGRFFSKIISTIICLIGFIIAGFDKEKRALHDMICSTRVIKE